MSLINQMLKELEQHHKPVDHALPKEVHAVEDQVKPHQAARLAIIALAAATMIGGAYYMGARWKPEQPPPLPAAQVLPAPFKPHSAALQVAASAKPVPAHPAPERVEHKPETKIKPETAVQEQSVGQERESKTSDKLVKQVSPAEQSEYHYQRGAALLQQGRLAEAESELRSALRFKADHVAARQVLTGLLIEQKRYKEAEEVLQAGLQQDPGRVEFSMTLARLQVESGDNQSALDTLKSALPHAGDDAEFYGFYAALLQRAGQHADAVDYFSMALRKMPSAGKWWVGMGISLKEEKKMQEAQTAFSHALSIQNLSPELRAYAEQQISAITKAERP